MEGLATYSVYIDQERAERRREVNEAILEIMDQRDFCWSRLAAAPSRIWSHGRRMG